MNSKNCKIISYKLTDIPKDVVPIKTTLCIYLDVGGDFRDVVTNKLNILSDNLLIKTFAINFDEDNKDGVYVEAEIIDEFGMPAAREIELNWSWDKAKKFAKHFYDKISISSLFCVRQDRDYVVYAERLLTSNTLEPKVTHAHICYDKTRILPEIARSTLAKCAGKNAITDEISYQGDLAQNKVRQLGIK